MERLVVAMPPYTAMAAGMDGVSEGRQERARTVRGPQDGGEMERLRRRIAGRGPFGRRVQKVEVMSESRTPATARVIVGVSGSPGSLTALGRAAGEARHRGAELWPVLTWQAPEGDLAARRFPASASMVPAWEQLARERLIRALREVFGSIVVLVSGTKSGWSGHSAEGMDACRRGPDAPCGLPGLERRTASALLRQHLHHHSL